MKPRFVSHFCIVFTLICLNFRLFNTQETAPGEIGIETISNDENDVAKNTQTDGKSDAEIDDTTGKSTLPEHAGDVTESTDLVMEVVGPDSSIINSTMTNVTDSTNSTATVRQKRVACLLPEMMPPEMANEADYEEGSEADVLSEEKDAAAVSKSVAEPAGVKLLNGSHFLHILSDQFNANVTNRTTPAICMVVFFYARWCPFSAEAASHFNAFGRIYSNMKVVAVDSSRYHGVNTQFGILALPTILLFHNSKPVSKFNQTSSFTLDDYAQFISTLTGIEAEGLLEVTESDFSGPLPTVAEIEPDYLLYLAWIFTLVCALFYFSKSSFSKRLIESIQGRIL